MRVLWDEDKGLLLKDCFQIWIHDAGRYIVFDDLNNRMDWDEPEWNCREMKCRSVEEVEGMLLQYAELRQAAGLAKETLFVHEFCGGFPMRRYAVEW